jgi:hypothetical protein
MVLADSRRVSPAPRYSGIWLDYFGYLYGTFTLYGVTFQKSSNSRHNLLYQTLQPHNAMHCGLGLSLFARHYLGNHYCSIFLWVLRCFSSPGSPPRKDVSTSSKRVAPFGNLRFKRLFAPYRSLSQLTTSFIASESQGIHLTPLIAFVTFKQFNFSVNLSFLKFSCLFFLLLPICQITLLLFF